MKRRLVLVGALAAFCLLGGGLALANYHGKSVTGTTSFVCSASIVSVDPTTRALVVNMWSGSRSVEAYRGQKVTLQVDEMAKIVDALSHGRSSTLDEMRSGTPVEIAGTIDRTASAPPRFIATKIIAQKLVWSDEFNGPAGAAPDPTKWEIDGGGNARSHQREYYTASTRNVALDGQGHLAITALRETYSGGGYTRNYTSGKIDGQGKYSTTYGSIQASIKLPAGRGLWPAFWALGTDIDQVGYPKSGEIDIMENLGRAPCTVYGTIHGPTTASPQDYYLSTSHRTTVSLAQGFHVYGLNWSPNLVQMTLDGVPYATYRPSSLARGQQWVFNKPFFLILNLAVGGNWAGAPKATTQFPARMLVDWVHVYS
jgi:beta-glucanase (GH16 family)